ncbi:MAG: response regulator [Spirochaetales bacterium]|nr:response regulator [Spirochaetales bacterium]
MKRKILIVDDEPINLEFFEVMLSKLGFEVNTAVNGEEALEKVEEFLPDLIILDNIMPKLTGWEVTKKLKNEDEYKKFKHVPIIMFSAMDGVNDKIEGLELGVDDYITKPFVFREVLARIKAVLRHREMAVQISRREERLDIIESLNDLLLGFFSQHIKAPISDLVALAEGSDLPQLKKDVLVKGKEILSTLQSLDEKIEKMQNKGNTLKNEEITLEELEKRYADHFKKLEEDFDD